MKKGISVFLAACLLAICFSGCGKETIPAVTAPGGVTAPSGESIGSATLPAGETAPAETPDFAQTDGDMFTDRDKNTEYQESKRVTLRFDGSRIESSSDSVKISGSTVTLTEEATYILSGTLDSGSVVVNAGDKDKLQLVLSGVSIHSESSAALYILGGDKVFVTLAEGTENTLSSGESFVAIDENNIDGAIFSKQDLTFNGSGSLTVSSPGGHGIVCKDDLVFTGGSYTVNSSGHGLDANDSVRITGTALTVDAGKDAIHAENNDDAALGFVYISGGSMDLEAEGDGISAGSYLQINDGSIAILAGGGWENGESHSSGGFGDFMGGGHGGGPGRPRSGSVSASEEEDGSTSMKGMKAQSGILIGGGSFVIDSADDAVHSNTSAAINGGSFQIASGDDALHAEEDLTFTAGSIEITHSYEGLEALNIAVKGGDIRLTATDDGLNAAGGTDSSGTGGRDQMFGGGMFGGGMHGSAGNGSIVISGGSLYVNASGDGIDANGCLLISGGYTVVVGPTQGDTATLDYDTSATITGGTFIGTGASGMAQTFSDSEQGVFAVSVGNQSAGTTIRLTDSSGKELLSYAPELNFAVVILSTPELVTGTEYTVYVGSQSGTFPAS